MRKKLITAIAVAGVGVVSFAGGANAEPRDGLVRRRQPLGAPRKREKSGVAKSSPGALAEVIQLHLDVESSTSWASAQTDGRASSHHNSPGIESQMARPGLLARVERRASRKITISPQNVRGR